MRSANCEKLYQSARIRHAEIDGLIVVMDLEEEQYHIFDEQATAMWHEIVRTAGNTNDAMKGVLSRLSGDSDTIQSHFKSFVAQCIDRRFLSPEEPVANDLRDRVATSPMRSSCLPFRACWSLFLTGASLKIRGFRRTYEDFGTLRHSLRSVSADLLLAKATQAFLWAENVIQFSKMPDDCVPRSLALFRFLRTIGLPVVHRIGGRRFPTFTMHAWVEYDGRAILDDPLEIEKDVILSSLPTRISYWN
jgi:hypothetical protein